MVSLMSALMIQGNETIVDVYSNKEKTGYGFVVYLIKGGNSYRYSQYNPKLPNKTDNEAKTAGEELVEGIKKMDLNPQRSKLENIIGPEKTKSVSEIIKKANG